MKTVTILGSGPAGLTAAIYVARGGFQPILVAGTPPGGALMTTTDVENYPGFPDGVPGPELIENMHRQAERFGTRFVEDHVHRAELAAPPFTMETEGGQAFQADAVILAVGAATRWLGLASETRLRGRGVSSCATCDGFFFKGRDLVVVGGGDSAMEEALFLSRLARTVTVVLRAPKPRASHLMVEKAKAQANVRFIPEVHVRDILGDEVVTGVRLERADGTFTEVPCHGVFVAIGHVPNTAFLRGQIELDDDGYVKLYPCSSTSVQGVFVAGDAYDRRYMQAVTAAASGCRAALDCIRYLEEGRLSECPGDKQ